MDAITPLTCSTGVQAAPRRQACLASRHHFLGLCMLTACKHDERVCAPEPTNIPATTWPYRVLGHRARVSASRLDPRRSHAEDEGLEDKTVEEPDPVPLKPRRQDVAHDAVVSKEDDKPTLFGGDCFGVVGG